MLEMYTCLLLLNALRNYASVYACMFSIPVMYHVKLLNSSFILVHVHGVICPFVCGVGRNLFTGRRVRDVTVSGIRAHVVAWA